MSKTKEITDYLAHPCPFLAWTILILSILFNGYALTLQVSSAKLTKELMSAFQIDLPLYRADLHSFHPRDSLQASLQL